MIAQSIVKQCAFRWNHKVAQGFSKALFRFPITKALPVPVALMSRPFAVHASVHARMELYERRYKEISEELSSNMDLTSDQITKLSIEMGDIEPTIETIQSITSKRNELSDLEEIIDEPISSKVSDDDLTLREMAREEHAALRKEIEQLENKLTRLLLPKDKSDDKSAILEVRAGTGGDEAALFAEDIFRMYQKHAALRGWKFEILSISNSDAGGMKEASASIKGHGVYGRLKFESGAHRVQRVPVNDVRVHTSAMTVAVLPEIAEVDAGIKASDLRIDTYRAGGAGGQHVNTTDSAVRITHLPTGIVAAVQDERSQHKNKSKAMKILTARVYDTELRRQQAERSSMRSQQIGTGDRSERIRTYNYPQSRVTDHRIGLTLFGVDRMMNGELLDEIVDGLILHNDNVALEEMMNSDS